jgi:Mg-chelatase subunit ChlD
VIGPHARLGMRFCLAAGIALASSAVASPAQTLTIGQGVGVSPDLTVYVDLVDAQGEAPATIPASTIAASIGAHTVDVRGVRPFADGGEGVAYIFLVDVSQSLSVAEMTRVREAISLWAGALGPRDRAALITFGDDVSTVLDFTADRSGLARAAATFAPRARTTQLHTAIERAIALGRRRDADLPGRRVAIVLSDGHDEGSGLTADDVAARLREDRLPIYAIGFSRLRGEARERGFDTLRRFARNSGGLFSDASSAPILPGIYQAMRHAVTRVFALDLHCAACPADGGLHRLQIQVKAGTRILADGIDLRLPAAVSPAGAATAGVGAGGAATSGAGSPGSGSPGAGSSGPGSSGASSSSAAPGESPEARRQRADDERARRIALQRDRERRAARAYWIVGAVATFLAVAIPLTVVVIVRQRRRSAVARGSVVGAGADTVANAGAAGETGRENGSPGSHADGIAIACHFLGRHARPPVTLALRDHVIIGADPTSSGLVIYGDHEVAAAHCELTWEDGRVMLRRIDAAYATLVNGASVHPSSSYRLESGDVLLVGRTELRVMFDEGLP